MSDEKPGVDLAEAAIPGVVVMLPAGIMMKDGVVHREAELIPMTGLTRKAIAREDIRSSPHKITSVMILQCLRRVGPLTNISKVLDEMLVGDRDFLMLEIRRVSMGNDINATVECEKCKNKIDVKFSIDELEVVKLKDGDYEVKDGVRVFRITNANPRIDVLCRFPNGPDQQIMASLLAKNPVEAMFKLYSCCVLEWNGKAGPFEPRFFEGLPVSILDKFEGAFSDKLPGPILKQSVPCPVCTADIEFTFAGSDFFFRQGKRGKT